MKCICVFLACIFLLSGCNIVSQTGGTTIQDQSDATSHAAVSVPPFYFILGNYDMIADLSRLLDMSDAEVTDYLMNSSLSTTADNGQYVRRNNLYLNGLKNKEDVKSLLSTFSNVYFPIVEEAQPTVFFYPDTKGISVNYGIGQEATHYFYIPTEADSAQKEIQSIQAENKSLVEISGESQVRSGILSETITFPDGLKIYVDTEESVFLGNGTPIKIFQMDIHGAYANVQIVDTDDVTDAARRLAKVKFEKLSFSKDGAKIVEE